MVLVRKISPLRKKRKNLHSQVEMLRFDQFLHAIHNDRPKQKAKEKFQKKKCNPSKNVC